MKNNIAIGNQMVQITEQGYGTATIKKVHVYEKIGFIPTGDINHGAVEMKFTL